MNLPFILRFLCVFCFVFVGSATIPTFAREETMRIDGCHAVGGGDSNGRPVIIELMPPPSSSSSSLDTSSLVFANCNLHNVHVIIVAPTSRETTNGANHQEDPNTARGSSTAHKRRQIIFEHFGLYGRNASLAIVPSLNRTMTHAATSSDGQSIEGPIIQFEEGNTTIQNVEVHVLGNVTMEVGGRLLVVLADDVRNLTMHVAPSSSSSSSTLNCTLRSNSSVFSIVAPTISNAAIRVSAMDASGSEGRVVVMESVSTVVPDDDDRSALSVASFITDRCTSCVLSVAWGHLEHSHEPVSDDADLANTKTSSGIHITAVARQRDHVVAASYLATPSHDASVRLVLEQSSLELGIRPAALVTIRCIGNNIVICGSAASSTAYGIWLSSTLEVRDFKFYIGASHAELPQSIPTNTDESTNKADRGDFSSSSGLVLHASGNTHSIVAGGFYSYGKNSILELTRMNVRVIDGNGGKMDVEASKASSGHGLVAIGAVSIGRDGSSNVTSLNNSLVLTLANNHSTIGAVSPFASNQYTRSIAVAGGLVGISAPEGTNRNKSLVAVANYHASVTLMHHARVLVEIQHAVSDLAALGGILCGGGHKDVQVQNGAEVTNASLSTTIVSGGTVSLSIGSSLSGVSISSIMSSTFGANMVTSVKRVSITLLMSNEAVLSLRQTRKSANAGGTAISSIGSVSPTTTGFASTLVESAIVCGTVANHTAVDISLDPTDAVGVGVLSVFGSAGSLFLNTTVTNLHVFVTVKNNSQIKKAINGGRYTTIIGGVGSCSYSSAFLTSINTTIVGIVDDNSVVESQSHSYSYGVAAFGLTVSMYQSQYFAKLENVNVSMILSNNSMVRLQALGKYIRGAAVGGIAVRGTYAFNDDEEWPSYANIAIHTAVHSGSKAVIYSAHIPTANTVGGLTIYGSSCYSAPHLCASNISNLRISGIVRNNSQVAGEAGMGLRAATSKPLICDECHLTVIAEQKSTISPIQSFGSYQAIVLEFSSSTQNGCCDNTTALQPSFPAALGTLPPTPLQNGSNISAPLRGSVSIRVSDCLAETMAYRDVIDLMHDESSFMDVDANNEGVCPALVLDFFEPPNPFPHRPAHTATGTVSRSHSHRKLSLTETVRRFSASSTMKMVRTPTNSATTSPSMSNAESSPTQSKEEDMEHDRRTPSLQKTARLAATRTRTISSEVEPPSTESPTPSPQKTSISVVPKIGLEGTAREVTVTVGVAGLSALAPTSATTMGKLGAVSQLVECSFSDTDLTPSPIEHPLSPHLGTSPYKALAGAALCSTFICLVPTVLTTLLNIKCQPSAKIMKSKSGSRSSTSSSSKSTSTNSNASISKEEHSELLGSRGVSKYLGVLHVATFGYFIPNILNLCSTIFWHADQGTARTEVLVGVLTFLLCCGMVILRVWTVNVSLLKSMRLSTAARHQLSKEKKKRNVDRFESIIVQSVNVDEEQELLDNTSFASSASISSSTSSTSSTGRTKSSESSTDASSTAIMSFPPALNETESQLEFKTALRTGLVTSWGQTRSAARRPYFLGLFGSFFDASDPQHRLKRHHHDPLPNEKEKNSWHVVVFVEPLRRSYFLIDVGLTSLITFLAGTRPGSRNGCLRLAWSTGFIGLLFLAYLLFLKPIRSRLETFLTVTMAMSHLVSAGASVLALSFSEDDDQDKKEQWANVVSISLTFQMAHYFVAAAMQGIWAIILEQRRRAKFYTLVAEEQRGEGALVEDESVLLVPFAKTSSPEHHQIIGERGEEMNNVPRHKRSSNPLVEGKK